MKWISARRNSCAPFATAAVTLAVLAPGCGDEDDADAGPVGQELGGSVAQLAQCSDWRDADPVALLGEPKGRHAAAEAGPDDQPVEVVPPVVQSVSPSATS